MSKLKVAIIGATGLVGQTFLKVLAENNEGFDLKLFASSKSQGKRIKFQNRYYIVNKLDENAFIIVCDANEVFGKGFNSI